jgi:hypothetical protein
MDRPSFPHQVWCKPIIAKTKRPNQERPDHIVVNKPRVSIMQGGMRPPDASRTDAQSAYDIAGTSTCPRLPSVGSQVRPKGEIAPCGDNHIHNAFAASRVRPSLSAPSS